MQKSPILSWCATELLKRTEMEQTWAQQEERGHLLVLLSLKSRGALESEAVYRPPHRGSRKVFVSPDPKRGFGGEGKDNIPSAASDGSSYFPIRLVGLPRSTSPELLIADPSVVRHTALYDTIRRGLHLPTFGPKNRNNPRHRQCWSGSLF